MGSRVGTPEVTSARSKFAKVQRLKFAKVQMLPYAALLVASVVVVVAVVVAHAVAAPGPSVPRAETLAPQLSAAPGVAHSFAVAKLPPAATHKPSAKPTKAHKVTAAPALGSAAALVASHVPLAGGEYAGSLIVDKTGSQLTAWDQTRSLCTSASWEVPDGTVSTNASGDATLETTGADGSCVAIVSPDHYSSAVIEAYIDFPALPGSNMVANWTSLWLTDTDADTWPEVGELDSVEVEPDVGVSAATYHWGSRDNVQTVSTGSYGAEALPAETSNITPGWHVVDVVWTSGFFAVYYDGRLFTSYSNSVVTGDPLQVTISSSVTPDISAIQQALGGPPVNSDSSPATIAVKYVKIWSYK